jgi:hypothetical protein
MAMVRDTISGIIIDALDHVLMTVFWLLRCRASTFFISLASTKGPFFVDLDTGPSLRFLAIQ